MAIDRLENVKVGDDVVLSCAAFDDAGQGLALLSAWVTVVCVSTDERVVEEEPAELDEDGVARFVWTPAIEGDHIIEWHLEHAGGRTKYTSDTFVRVDHRWTAAAPPAPPPVAIGDVTQSATGAVLVSGSQAATIGDVAQSAGGGVAVFGAQSLSFGDVTQSASAAAVASGNQSASIGSVSSTAVGQVRVAGAQAVSIGLVTQVAIGIGFQGALDSIVAAGGVLPAAAYSCSHRLYSMYSGFLIRIRRASDNAQTDIGYTANGRLDEAAIASFCGASDGSIVTWYDNTGAGRDVTQATNSRQDKIYDGATGQVSKQGSLPWATQTGLAVTSPGYSRGDALGISGAVGVTHFCFAAHTSVASNNRVIMSIGAGSGRFSVGAASNSPAAGDLYNWVINGTGIRYFTDSPASSTPSHFFYSIGAGAQVGTSTVRQNGAALTQSGTANPTVTLTVSGSNYAICMDTTGNTGYTGGACCFMTWGSELTGAPRAALETFGESLRALS